MSDTEKQARDAVTKLLEADPDQLFAELGIRQKAIASNASVAGSFDPTVTYDAKTMGPMDVMKDFGRSFFKRVNRDVYGLVCGTDEAFADERKKLADAISTGQTAFATVLATACVAWFGWAPAIAAVIAALVVKLFFRSAQGAMCDVWKGKLPNP